MNGQQWLDLLNKTIALVAVANPAQAGAAAAIEGGMGMLTGLILPAIKTATAAGELTPEQETQAFAEAQTFWAAVADGSAFIGKQWEKTTTPGQ